MGPAMRRRSPTLFSLHHARTNNSSRSVVCVSRLASTTFNVREGGKFTKSAAETILVRLVPGREHVCKCVVKLGIDKLDLVVKCSAALGCELLAFTLRRASSLATESPRVSDSLELGFPVPGHVAVAMKLGPCRSTVLVGVLHVLGLHHHHTLNHELAERGEWSIQYVVSSVPERGRFYETLCMSFVVNRGHPGDGCY